MIKVNLTLKDSLSINKEVKQEKSQLETMLIRICRFLNSFSALMNQKDKKSSSSNGNIPRNHGTWKCSKQGCEKPFH